MTSSNDELLQELEGELHDLCQPLTALHFRLEVGKFAGDQDALREAVDGALAETARMIDSIKRMRARVMAMKTAAEPEAELQHHDESLRAGLTPVIRGARR